MIPCWSKAAVACGKCGLGKVANVDWHEISASVIKNATCRPESQISKIATCPLLYHLPTRSNTPPAAAGGERRGGHTPAPLVCRRAREVGRQCCRRPRVVPIHCTVERAPLGHGRRAPRMAGGGSTGGPHSAWPGYMCCRACTAESTAPRSTVHLKRIPEDPCAKARRRHGAHRRHGVGRPAPFVCRSPGQRPTHSLKGSVSEAPAHVSVLLGGACVGGAQPRASTAGSSLERRGRANVQVRAAELLAFLLTEQHSRWCNCMC